MKSIALNQLNRYILRQLVIAFTFAAAAVSFVVLFTQSFRLLSLVIDNSATMLYFFQLMATSVPTFMPLVLPLGLGVAVIFVYHKLAVDSELVVMRAVGISPMRQALPAIILASLVLLVCYLLTLWITPLANRHFVALEYKMRDNYGLLLSRPGNFNDISDGVTFYARARGSNGALQGVLMHDVRNPATPVTIMAERGQLVDTDGTSHLVIFDGRRQEMNMATGKLSQLAFDQYVVDIDSMRRRSSFRYPDPREQNITQLLNPTEDFLAHKTSAKRLTGEIHMRLSSPLLALTYSFIGLAAILAGEFNRRGMGKRLLIAAISIVSMQAMTMSMNGIVSRNNWMAIFLYLGVLTPVIVALALLNAQHVPFLRSKAPALKDVAP